jgi:hypothetical protein
MKEKKALIGVWIILICILTTSGCFENSSSENNVTVTVLYSSPQHINNTTVYLDGVVFLEYTDVEIETYPPMLGDKTVKMDNGKHEITVNDKNFNLTATKTINVDSRTYVEIIISYDEIDISQSDKPTGYK